MDYCRRINMITAKEAYDRAEKIRMRDIENSIEIASSNGFQRHTIDYAISNEAIEKLKANGYEVTVIPPQRLREKTKTTISLKKTGFQNYINILI